MLLRITLIIALIALCTVSHFIVPHHDAQLHEFLFKATYVPIILAALWFGIGGGMVASGLTSILYLIHIQFQLGGHMLGANLGWTLDLVLYNGIALVTGALSQAQSRARRKAEVLADAQSSLRKQLEASYTALRKQTGELLETTEQLQRSEKLAALGELTASIAHEIRNPLNGISGAADIICNEKTQPEVRAEFSNILRKESSRLNQVVKNILNFTRVNRAEVRDADVRDIAQRLIKLTEKEAQDHKIRVAQEIPPGLKVQADVALIEHALLNLMLNAIQAMPSGGTLTLSAAANGRLIALTVADTGPGIPAQLHEQIFSPFYTTKPGGTGLGLAIARRIARGMGGDIKLNSEKGKGAAFTMEIPLNANAVAKESLFKGNPE